jgi:hypothetical protein
VEVISFEKKERNHKCVSCFGDFGDLSKETAMRRITYRAIKSKTMSQQRVTNEEHFVGPHGLDGPPPFTVEVLRKDPVKKQ